MVNGENSLAVACGLLTTVASHVMEQGLQGTGSVVAGHRLSCSMTCRTFLDQGSSPFSLHWHTDSSLLGHQGNREVINTQENFTEATHASNSRSWNSSEGSNEHIISVLYLKLCLHNSLKSFLKNTAIQMPLSRKLI